MSYPHDYDGDEEDERLQEWLMDSEVHDRTETRFDNGWYFVTYNYKQDMEVHSPDFTRPVATRDKYLRTEAIQALKDVLSEETPDIATIEAIMASPPPEEVTSEERKKIWEEKLAQAQAVTDQAEQSHIEIEPADPPSEDAEESDQEPSAESKVDPDRVKLRQRRIDMGLFAVGATVGAAALAFCVKVIQRGMR